MTRRIAPELLPYHRDAAVPLAGRSSSALLGTGLDDFALYTALREARRAAGGAAANYLVSWPYKPDVLDVGAANPLTSQRLFLVPQLVPAGQAIDGVGWLQTVNGNYTPSNVNGIAAYTFDGTTFTRVGQGTSTTTWSGGVGYQVQAFGTQLAAFGVDTLVWAAGLWNRSAVVTAPSLLGPSMSTPAASALGLGSWGMEIDVAAQINFPATFLAAALSLGFTNHPWLAFYRNFT